MIVLIHGIGDKGTDMAPIGTLLNGAHPTFAPTMLNHIGRPIKADCTFEELIEDFVRQLDTAKIGPSYFLGYSFGGFVAMTLARRHPERVKGVITLAGKFIFDDHSIAHIQYLFSPEYLQKVPPQLRETYNREWGPMLPLIRANCSRMYGGFQANPPLTEQDLQAVEQPVLLISGDQDPIVGDAESRRMAELLPNARLAVFPGAAHPMRRIPMGLVSNAVQKFIEEVEAGSFDPSVPADMEALAGAA